MLRQQRSDERPRSPRSGLLARMLRAWVGITELAPRPLTGAAPATDRCPLAGAELTLGCTPDSRLSLPPRRLMPHMSGVGRG